VESVRSVRPLVTTITTHSESETSAVGRELAATLSAGAVVLLHGDLGAGKTAFVRGLAEGLGVAPAEVSSPTFTLVQEYRGGRLTLFHVDLYRLDDQREIDDLGLEEIGADAVLTIEWAQKLEGAAWLKPWRSEHIVEVRLTHGEGDTRNLSINYPITQSPNYPIHSDR
jgi:tRNA threonylcarbamoyladenosine biosynthesis protein TsaE